MRIALTLQRVLISIALLVALSSLSVAGFSSSGSRVNVTRASTSLRSFLGVGTDSQRSTGIALNGGTGSLVLTGGVAGYLAKGSKASLVSGSGIGCLLLLSAALISKNKESAIGTRVGSVVAGLLTYVMGKKFLRSRALFPPGILMVLGGITFLHDVAASLSKKG